METKFMDFLKKCNITSAGSSLHDIITFPSQYVVKPLDQKKVVVIIIRLGVIDHNTTQQTS